ncbi:MAG: hypothetical protein IKT89_01760 [Clostridia bacterium]|jgi:hypothetical protein|nr:hypothetical protein [Clostridia bacterium]
MGFIFNFDNFKKGKKKINPFDLVEDFDYDFAESFEMDDYELDDYDEYDENYFYRDDD